MYAALLTILPALASAATIMVDVGNNELKFNPDTATPKAGDVLYFTIHPTHNVAQGTFDNPCKPIGSNAIWSGDDAKSFAVTVNDTNPMWFYCATGDHCSEGMVMAVNNPSSMSLSDYMANAKKGGEGEDPDTIQGGVLNMAAPSGSSSGTMSSGSMAMSSSMMASSAMMSSSMMMSSSGSMAMSTGSMAMASSASGSMMPSMTESAGAGGSGSSSATSAGLAPAATPLPAAAALVGGILGLAYLL